MACDIHEWGSCEENTFFLREKGVSGMESGLVGPAIEGRNGLIDIGQKILHLAVCRIGINIGGCVWRQRFDLCGINTISWGGSVSRQIQCGIECLSRIQIDGDIGGVILETD